MYHCSCVALVGGKRGETVHWPTSTATTVTHKAYHAVSDSDDDAMMMVPVL